MSETINCIAIDDELPALDILKKFCQRAGNVALKTFTDPVAGIEAIVAEHPDVVFLDIEMEGMTGLEVASRLPRTVCLIFTTAYLNYAIDGFDLDAVDYLHKPFAYSRFEMALKKAMRRITASKTAASAESIVVKQEYSNVSIPLDDILYIEAMEAYSKIFRAGGQCTITRATLKNIGAMLPADRFVRVHRSFIVSRAKVAGFTRHEVALESGAKVPVGRLYAAHAVKSLS